MKKKNPSKNEEIKIIFVIGAARSGTRLIADIIRDNIRCETFYEINNFWKKPFPFLKTDFIPSSLANTKKGQKLKEKFLAKIKGNVVIEKTAANSLRIPFLSVLFPNALFVHILRDGREVAISARKKYYGDFRKITQKSTAEIKWKDRVSHLLTEVFHKIKIGLNVFSLLINLKRFLYMVLKELGITKYSPWGPRYPGYEYLFKRLSPLEIAADQWQYSVLQIKNFFEYNPKCNYFELKYEELLSHPDSILNELFDFINIDFPDEISQDIVDKTVNSQFVGLDVKEKELLSQRINFTLKSLGY